MFRLPILVTKAKPYDESKHPRDAGKFSHTAGAGAHSDVSVPDPAEVHEAAAQWSAAHAGKHKENYQALMAQAKEARKAAHAHAISGAKQSHESANKAADAIQELNNQLAWHSDNEDHDSYRELDELIGGYDPTAPLSERMTTLKDITTAAKGALKVELEFDEADEAETKKITDENHGHLRKILGHAKEAREHLRRHAAARREAAAIKSPDWLEKCLREMMTKGPFRLPLVMKAGRFDESKHRRGQPKNRGQFGSGGGGSGGSKKPSGGGGGASAQPAAPHPATVRAAAANWLAQHEPKKPPAGSVSRDNPDLDAFMADEPAKKPAASGGDIRGGGPDIFGTESMVEMRSPPSGKPKRKPKDKPQSAEAPAGSSTLEPPPLPDRSEHKESQRQAREMARHHAREGKIAGLMGDKIGAKRGRMIAANYRKVAGFHSVGMHEAAHEHRRKTERVFGLNSTATPPKLSTNRAGPAQPPPLPHKRTQEMAMQAIQKLSASRSATDHGAVVAALAAHEAAGKAHIDRTSSSPQDAARRHALFQQKLSKVRAKVDRMGGKGPPPVPHRSGQQGPYPQFAKPSSKRPPPVPLRSHGKAFDPWLESVGLFRFPPLT